MDMSQSTRKWSELHGIAVISVADGKKIGTCDDFYFDPITQSVYALQVKTGRFGQELEGQLRLAVADLRPFTGMFGYPIEGELALNATARQSSPDQIVATLEGSIEKLHSGLPALDVLTGGSVAIAGLAQRDSSGVLRLDQLSMIGAGSHVAATGSFDPTTQQLAATLDTEIRDLQPAGAALGTTLGGKISGNIAVAGLLDGLRVHARIDGSDIAAGSAALEQVRLEAELMDAAQPHGAGPAARGGCSHAARQAWPASTRSARGPRP